MSQVYSRWILMCFLGLSLGSPAYAQIYKCIHSDDGNKVSYIMDIDRSTYENSGYRCVPIAASIAEPITAVSTPRAPGDYIIYQRGNAQVVEKIDSESTSSGSKNKLTKEECLIMLQVSEHAMTPDEIACTSRFAPEIKKGRELTPSHADAMTAVVSLIDYDRIKGWSDGLQESIQPSVISCQDAREAVLNVIRKSPDYTIRELVEIKHRYHSKQFSNKNDQEEYWQLQRKQWNIDRSNEINKAIPLVNHVQQCVLGMPKVVQVGQMMGSTPKMRSERAVKGLGQYDFSDEILNEAVNITSRRKVITASAH